MASLNKVCQLYEAGKSIPDVADETGLPRSTVRYHLKKAGVLRSREDGIRLAAHKLGSGRRGRTFPMTDKQRANVSAGRKMWADANAAGFSVKPSGYVEHTRGPHKGRSQHVVLMEERIGRRIKSDEVVHHIDGDRANNAIDNLALMTRAAHTRLHRREEQLARKGN